MNWINVEDILPDDSYPCFILGLNDYETLTYGYGYYRRGYTVNPITRKPEISDTKQWFLDYDAYGSRVLYWMKIEVPKNFYE